MGRVLALVDDLFFQSKMLETAKHVGAELKLVTTADALLAEAQQQPPTLIIVDLNARNAPLEAIAKLRAAGATAPLIAFFSHVQVELAERARAAGCQQVLPRSKLTQQLAAILSEAKP